MTIISDTDALAAVCAEFASEDFVTIDTEFMREKTYYPQLCLVQLGNDEKAVAVDTLANGIDLAPLVELLKNRNVLKVFHAARQDLEIFYHLCGELPAPVFDTQIAAMVCGFGDQVSYDKLVQSLTGVRLDKSSRFADWSHRPLSEKQLGYALADVTHLRKVYRKLVQKIESTGRQEWIEDEVAKMADPDLYDPDPETVWQRLKVRSGKPKFLAVLQQVAAFREREARQRDVPRNRILRDDVLMDLAAHAPTTPEELARTRTFNAQTANGRLGKEIIAVVEKGLAIPPADCPTLPEKEDRREAPGPIVELLKVLLKIRSDEEKVAARLIANASDIEAIALDDDADVPALKGWRREIFGGDAINLKHGRIGLTAEDGKIKLMRL
ncbi:MAG: ribonuclease D [Nisaea sp.]|uniref:ribonuclease D n=1 Tax=Nisaea sp. TaxID=2024842 RepID=UPI001B1C9A33|nr:ribonuclease D [Nisaea sp.]MBO6562771.1 ribonuclease D [Nisaea sp.]